MRLKQLFKPFALVLLCLLLGLTGRAWAQTTTTVNVGTSWTAIGYGPLSMVATGATAGGVQFAMSDTTPTASTGIPIPVAGAGVAALTPHKIWAIAPGASAPVVVTATVYPGMIGVADAFIENAISTGGGGTGGAVSQSTTPWYFDVPSSGSNLLTAINNPPTLSVSGASAVWTGHTVGGNTGGDIGLFNINGATPAVGNGQAGAGGLRATLSQDSVSYPINIATATTTQLIALSGSTAIYITSWDVIAGGTGTFELEYGTGTNCGTGTTALTGAYPLTAQVGLTKGAGIGTVLKVPAGNALCGVTNAAVQYSGSVSALQF